MRPVVLHIPHSSRFIAPEVRATLLPSVERIEHELLILTDAWTDQIVEGLALDAKRIIFPVSRLVVDPERFSRDEDEPMAKKGMGATYTKLSSGETLRVLSKGERRQLMETYY